MDISQMKPLTLPMANCLCDLYSESGGRVGIAYPIKAHWKVIETLFERGFIMRDAQIERGKVVRYIALTPFGANYSCEHLEVVINANVMNASRPRKCVALFFEYDEKKYPSHMAAFERVGELKASGDFRPTMIELINMDKELEKGQIGMLMDLYPEAIQSVRDMVRLELEAELKAQNNHVLKEMIRQTVQDAMQNTPLSTNTGLNSGVSVGLRAMSHDNDDSGLIEVKKDMQSGAIATLNFLASMERLNGVKLQPAPVTPPTGNPRVITTAALPMPVFEDD